MSLAEQRARAERLLLTFFATRSDGTTAAVFRIGMGMLAVWQALGVCWNLERFYGDGGVVPWAVVKNDGWVKLSLFSLGPDSHAILMFHAIAFMVGSIALLIGLYPRIASLLIAIVHVSLQFRNPFILNSGDRLFMIIIALGMAMPLARRASVHSLIRKLRGKPAPPLATVWGQRLVGLQLCYVYLNTVVAKLADGSWRGGTAMRAVLASPVFAEWPRYIDSKALIMAMTWGTLVFELAFPFLVWFKKTRPWILLAGTVFHLMIDALMIIPIFSYIMILTYPVFLSDDEVKWVLRKLRLPRAVPVAASDASDTTDATERSELRVPNPSS